MAMFNYGKSMTSQQTDELYKYHFFEEDLQVGYYPIDNFKAMKKYDEPKVLFDGMTAYGEVLYTKPLGYDQLSAYNLQEVVDEPVVQKTSKSNIVTTQPDVWLENVPKSRVYPCKKTSDIDKSYTVISLQYTNSNNGYGNLTLDSKNIVKNNNNTYRVNIGPMNSSHVLSVKSGDGYIKERKTVSEIQALYDNMIKNMANPNKTQHNVSQKSKVAASDTVQSNNDKPKVKLAYLNGISESDIHMPSANKNQNYRTVTIPFPESDNGFGNLTVHKNTIFQATHLQTHLPMTGKMNINLGPESNTVDISFLKDGKYQKTYMQSGELAQMFRDNRKEWRLRQMENKVADIMDKSEVSKDDDFVFM